MKRKQTIAQTKRNAWENFYENFIFYAKDEKEAKMFFAEGYDDGMFDLAFALRDVGVPLETIYKACLRLDKKAESITTGVVSDLLEDA